ncbi:transposase [Flavobacterium sp. I-SCBP12n]|uniref:Transposase n=1 Tax=Flavobacterium pygoscelis TaxID=2893176 RepID=A0A9X2BMF3_9FLAO|nr:transposase [Flavobacterium pygoscelis]MCK8140965.1 transposase [Flavobacterium pygoscelis]
MNKYQNKYRIPSTRLQNWDYGAMGAYFVTICTQNREHFFGEIVQTQCIVETHCNASLQNEMLLTDIGKKVEQEWLKTIALRPDMNLELGNFVVMPNHFHGILIIGKNEFNSELEITSGIESGIESRIESGIESGIESRRRDAMHRVSTDKTNKFGPQSKNLASIIRGFKSAVTTYSRTNGNTNFGWQPRFHDHIIRNSFEFERIQNYIEQNPAKWAADKFYK